MNTESNYASKSPRARKRAAKWRLAQMIKLEQGCVDCGYKKNAYALQFDHVGNDKKSGVSDLICRDYGWATIMKEIEKCEIVCANCHAIRTKERGQHSVRSVFVNANLLGDSSNSLSNVSE